MSKLIVFILLVACRISYAATCSEAEATSASKASDLVIEASSMAVSETEGRRHVTTLGKISNPTTACFSEVVVEVTYFDQNGKLVDTTTQELSDVIVPPKSDVSYRTVDSAMKARDAYASQKVRLTSAERRYARVKKVQPPEPGLVESLVIAWGPTLLLIVAWIMYIRRYLGKSSPQYQIQERLHAAAEAQVKALKEVALAIESSRR